MKGSSVEPSVKNEKISDKTALKLEQDDKKESTYSDSTAASTNGDMANGVSDAEMVMF